MTAFPVGVSAIELADRIVRREFSARETVQAFTDRIADLDGDLGAFVYLDNDGALAQAEEIDAAIARKETVALLAGVPFGVKDFSNVAGMPTVEGSRASGAGGAIALKDDPMISRLRAAGAVPLGKTNVPEFGMHSATYNERFGVSRNPWDLSKTPGGSSGGSSVAVSAGLVPFATGTDGGGSIRTPAAFCGLVGLKPTTALIPRANGESQMSCPGFLTTTVADTARLLDVAGGAHPADRLSVSMPGEAFERAIENTGTAGLKIVWSPDFGFAPMESEVVNIARAALDRLVSSARLIETGFSVALPNVYRDWISDSLNFLEKELIDSGVPIDRLDARTQRLLKTFSLADAQEHVRVRRSFKALEAALASVFDQARLLASPATACAAFGAEEEAPAVVAGQDAAWTGAEPLSMFANIAGVPAISIPAGVTRAGLPVGLQIAAPRFDDRLLLRLARILEECAPWPRLAPAYGEG